MNNSNFGYDCCNNLDNCLIYSNIWRIKKNHVP